MVQSWSPMIPESYPGLFYDPVTGKMSQQKEIMARLRWPKEGDIPYAYTPPRRRGFLGIEYPLTSSMYGPKWGYGSPEEKTNGLKEHTELDYMKKMLDAQVVIAGACVVTAVLTLYMLWGK